MRLVQVKKLLVILALAVSFVALFPISLRLADPLFTHPLRRGSGSEYPVVIVWPDHVEIRRFHDVSEISPLPKDAVYTFNIAPERQAWVEQQIRAISPPHGVDAGWIIHVKQLGRARQRIQLELLGDGIKGIVYEAGPEKIVPLRSRLTGPGGAFIILGIHLLLWSVVGGLTWLVFGLAKKYPQTKILR